MRILMNSVRISVLKIKRQNVAAWYHRFEMGVALIKLWIKFHLCVYVVSQTCSFSCMSPFKMRRDHGYFYWTTCRLYINCNKFNPDGLRQNIHIIHCIDFLFSSVLVLWELRKLPVQNTSTNVGQLSYHIFSLFMRLLAMTFMYIFIFIYQTWDGTSW